MCPRNSKTPIITVVITTRIVGNSTETESSSLSKLHPEGPKLSGTVEKSIKFSFLTL